jgi:hypothetical protein
MCFVPDLSPDSSSYEYNSLFSLKPDFDDAVAVQSKPLVVEIKVNRQRATLRYIFCPRSPIL